MNEQVESGLLERAAEESVVQTLPLPGGVLKAAREARGYSLGEVSQALKFGVRQLEALESDDYSSLKGSTFVRGFVRSYARYLKLDEVPLLAGLEVKVPVPVVDVHPVESMGAEMPSGTPLATKRAYVFAALVLLLGAVAWAAWQGHERDASVAVTDAATPVAAPTTAVVMPPQPDPSVSAPAATPQASPQVALPTQAPVVTPTATVATAAPAVEQAATSGAVPADASERQLVLNFSGVSWAEVRDAGNRVIYSGNSTPDSRQVVRGRPPFQLVIGNAQSVKLHYEDRSIDLQPYIRVDVARLTLDDNTK